MNKQELIEEIEGLPSHNAGCRHWIDKGIVLDFVEQLDEPEKVKALQFVADWYEENKDDFETSLFHCIYEIFKKRNDYELNEFEKWVIDENTEPFKTLVNMHQFGYEVEEEKCYTVKLTITKQYLYRRDNDFTFVTYTRPDDNPTLCHTRKELEEAGFGWVFDCDGVEVEEVEG